MDRSRILKIIIEAEAELVTLDEALDAGIIQDLQRLIVLLHGGIDNLPREGPARL